MRIWLLEGELDTFVADPNTGLARVALALVLIDQRQGSTTVLLQRTVAAEVRLGGDQPPAIADAMRAAIVDVLRQTEKDIAAAMH